MGQGDGHQWRDEEAQGADGSGRGDPADLSGGSADPQFDGYEMFDVPLGDLMRGERATLGKSLLDVERELRIRATYIAAIENGDIGAFQSAGFIAGYVRSYARYLGMDPERIASSGSATKPGFAACMAGRSRARRRAAWRRPRRFGSIPMT
jgi:cytoskeletal protein RodZ